MIKSVFELRLNGFHSGFIFKAVTLQCFKILMVLPVICSKWTCYSLGNWDFWALVSHFTGLRGSNQCYKWRMPKLRKWNEKKALLEKRK